MPLRLLSIVLASMMAVTVAARADDRLPRVATGWSLVPVLRFPSGTQPTAVVEAHDRTLFVGQTLPHQPGAHEADRGAVVTVKDGTTRTFAANLGSVRGLECLDDLVLAVHGTRLTSLRDADRDGQAEQQVDLVTGLGTLPGRSEKASGGYHGAAGLRRGMDGYLYIAVGDRGLEQARGRDGKSARMQGGGVIRVMPDGTGLEVVSTGVRNPLFVALDANDEVFSAGSADESGRWPGSLTHHIVGGHHGYPYDFLIAPFRALPLLSGELMRAGGQGVFYDADSLPAEFQGNLFLCDEGSGTVERFELRPSGGTFAVKQKSGIVWRGSEPGFQPHAITLQESGQGFWLTSLSDADGGCLYQLNWVAAQRSGSRPGTDGGSLEENVKALDHGSRSRRLEAQWRLAKMGGAAVGPLTARLTRRDPEIGRTHAMWALHAIGSPGARTSIRRALTDVSGTIRKQAARSVGIARDREALGALTTLLRDPEPAVRREAAIGLGLCGDPAAISSLLAAMDEQDVYAAWSIRRAIKLLGYPDRDGMARALLDRRRVENALKLADESWSPAVIQGLVLALQSTPDPALRARMVANLTGQFRKYPDWNGEWFGPDPLRGQRPLKTQNWDDEGMATVVRGLRQGLSDGVASVRFQAIVGLGQVGTAAAPVLREGLVRETDTENQMALIEALAGTKDPDSVALLTQILSDSRREEGVRGAALDVLGPYRNAEILRAKLKILYDPASPGSLVARAIPPLARGGFLPLNDLASFFQHQSPEVRASALLSLNASKALPEDVRTLVVDRLDDTSTEVRQAASMAIGTLKIREAVPKLMQAAGDPASELRSYAIAALARMPDPRAVDIYRAAARDRDPSLKRQGEAALAAIGARNDPGVARTVASETAGSSDEKKIPDPVALGKFALKHSGDPRKGEELFFESKSLACASCHAVQGRGTTGQGPDLGNVGESRDRNAIVSALLAPKGSLEVAHRSVCARAAELAPLELTDLLSFLCGLKHEK
jgi:HEAT repeat protein